MLTTGPFKKTPGHIIQLLVFQCLCRRGSLFNKYARFFCIQAFILKKAFKLTMQLKIL